MSTNKKESSKLLEWYNSMYHFNKNAVHVRFFKWAWDINPVDKYNTMCPYFWALVFTTLITFVIPVLPFVKGLTYINRSAGNKLRNWIIDKSQNRSKNKLQRITTTLTEEIRNIIKDKNGYEAYKLIYKSKCYRKYKYDLPIWFEELQQIKQLAIDYKYEARVEKDKQAAQRAAKRARMLETVTYRNNENKILSFILSTISVLVTAAVVGMILYATGILLKLIFLSVNWITVGKGLLIGLSIVATIVTAYLIIRYALIPFSDTIVSYVRCTNIECKQCNGIKKVLRAIFNVIAYVPKRIGLILIWTVDLLVAMYKRNCPRITWKQ